MPGILIISMGKKHYAELAVNLAASLRMFSKCKIALLTDGNITSVQGHDTLFDHIIQVEGNPFHIKTQIYGLSPFKETLYIDGDSLFLGRKSWDSLISELAGKSFVMMENGRYSSDSGKATVWDSVERVYNHYQLPKERIYPDYNSSFIYFVKSKENAALFKKAEKSYGSIKGLRQSVNGQFPDEVAFAAASISTNTYSDITGWKPAYFQYMQSLSAGAILSNYYFISLAGTQQNKNMLNIYNGSVKRNGQASGIRGIEYKASQKSYF